MQFCKMIHSINAMDCLVFCSLCISARASVLADLSWHFPDHGPISQDCGVLLLALFLFSPYVAYTIIAILIDSTSVHELFLFKSNGVHSSSEMTSQHSQYLLFSVCLKCFLCLA